MPEHGTQLLSNHYCAAKSDGVGPQGQESGSNLVRVAQDHLAAPNGSTKPQYVSRVVKDSKDSLQYLAGDCKNMQEI